MVKFEGMARRMAKIEECLKANGIENLEAAREICLSHGIDVDSIVKGVQPIAFENAVWAYTLGSAIALKKGAKDAVETEYLPRLGKFTKTAYSVFVSFATNGKFAQHNRDGNDENAQ